MAPPHGGEKEDIYWIIQITTMMSEGRSIQPSSHVILGKISSDTLLEEATNFVEEVVVNGGEVREVVE